jgi:hypothetical protein
LKARLKKLATRKRSYYRSFGRIKACGGTKIVNSLCGDLFCARVVPTMPESFGKCQQSRRMRTQMLCLTHGPTPFIHRRFHVAVVNQKTILCSLISRG